MAFRVHRRKKSGILNRTQPVRMVPEVSENPDTAESAPAKKEEGNFVLTTGAICWPIWGSTIAAVGTGAFVQTCFIK